MSKKLEQGDYVSLEYTGNVEGMVFDTTDSETAKKHGIFNQEMTYGPVTVCIGEHHILEGIDNALAGREEQESFSITVEPKEAFGVKDPKKIELVGARQFKQQGIKIHPGMQVQIDGKLATIKHVGGGRVLVDHNHPLAGKQVSYDIKINTCVTDKAKQIETILVREFKVPKPLFSIALKEDNAEITLKEIPFPEELQSVLKERILSLVDIKDCLFIIKEDKESKEQKNNEENKEPEQTETNKE